MRFVRQGLNKCARTVLRWSKERLARVNQLQDPVANRYTYIHLQSFIYTYTPLNQIINPATLVEFEKEKH